MFLDKVNLLKIKKKKLEKLKNNDESIHSTNYVVLPACLWSFNDEPKKERHGKRYVKNRKS